MALRAEYARKLLAAEIAYTQAKRALDAAGEVRERERNRCRAHLLPGERARAGGVEILVTPTSTGPSFRLKDYLFKHKLTKAMGEFVTEPTEYDRWTVRDIGKEKGDD